MLLYLSSFCSTENLKKNRRECTCTNTHILKLFEVDNLKANLLGRSQSRLPPNARPRHSLPDPQGNPKTMLVGGQPEARSAGGFNESFTARDVRHPIAGGEVNIRFPSQGTPLDSRFFRIVIGDSFAVALAPIRALLD